jgi:hypothetical protein
MNWQVVEVTARWLPDGRFEPAQFAWQGRTYLVESTGRQWEDADGLHALCMVPGGQVFELIFQLNPARWALRPPHGSARPA